MDLNPQDIPQWAVAVAATLSAPVAFIWKKVMNNDGEIKKAVVRLDNIEKEQTHIRDRVDDIYNHLIGGKGRD